MYPIITSNVHSHKSSECCLSECVLSPCSTNSHFNTIARGPIRGVLVQIRYLPQKRRANPPLGSDGPCLGTSSAWPHFCEVSLSPVLFMGGRAAYRKIRHTEPRSNLPKNMKMDGSGPLQEATSDVLVLQVAPQMLPDDIWMNVFKYLDTKKSVMNSKLVCKTWNKLVKEARASTFVICIPASAKKVQP